MIVPTNGYGVTLIDPLVNFASFSLFMQEKSFPAEVFRCSDEFAGMLRGDAELSEQP
jgi:hypothetical protein